MVLSQCIVCMPYNKENEKTRYMCNHKDESHKWINLKKIAMKQMLTNEYIQFISICTKFKKIQNSILIFTDACLCGKIIKKIKEVITKKPGNSYVRTGHRREYDEEEIYMELLGAENSLSLCLLGGYNVVYFIIYCLYICPHCIS